MADKYNVNQTPSGEPRKKADVILEKIDYLLGSTNEMAARVDKSVASANYISRQNSEIYEKTLAENASLKQQIKYLAEQNQNMYNKMATMVSELSDRVDRLHLALEKTEIEIDYDALAEAVADRIDSERIAKDMADILAENGAGRNGGVNDSDAEDAPYGIDYDLIADKVTEGLVRSVARSDESGEITISDIKEEISADYIAARVAEQIIIPDPDYDMIADAVFGRFYQDSDDAPDEEEFDDDGIVEEDYIPDEDELEEFAADENAEPEDEFIDYEKIADLVVSKLVASDEEYTEQEFETLDYERLADLISERVFRDDGQGEEIEEEETVEFDYDRLAEAIASKLSGTEVVEETVGDGDVIDVDGEPDTSVKLTEETLAQIVDEISKRVCEFLPEQYDIVVDDEGCTAIADAIRESLSAANENGEFDIVIDEEGVAEISDGVARKVAAAAENGTAKLSEFEQLTDKRLNKIESDVNEIKQMLKNGAAVNAAGELAAAEALAEDGESELVTVSDVIGGGDGEQAEEQTDEGIDEVIEEIVKEIDEQPVEGEVMPDGLDGASASVDFANMMKYNRSFIARIIQGSDDVKTYYGQTKTALLSYKKVNSSVAWGAERFNKGRETIAKFKIRGKTLCLYLALDPKEYKTSVYHQVDVSDNKSMATTPMMVKIKSPLGVKKAIRLIDDMLEKRGAIKQNIAERDYVAMYPYESIDELIEDGLVKDVSKNK